MKLEGKVAVVFGGSGGIGGAVVRGFVDRGAKVVVADINEARNNDNVDEVGEAGGDLSRVTFCKCDVRNMAQVENVFRVASERYGQLVEIAVTTVAVIDETNWELCVDVNLGGSIRFVNAALGHMGKDHGGQGGIVILTSSISGLQGELWGPVYSATKHGIIGLARSWAVPENFTTHGVRMNVVCPSATDTPFLGQVVKARHVDWHINRLETVDKYSSAEVTTAFIRFVEDESLNGQALRMSREKGNELVTFPDPVYV